MVQTKGIRISIDRGGTFTDVHYSVPGREDQGFKLLSVNPNAYDSAPAEGIRRILNSVRKEGKKIGRDDKMTLEDVESIRMGTTVATNALLERRGARTALLVTKGFADLLRIGNQSRPDIFDLSVHKLSQLYEKVVKIDERVTIATATEDPERQSLSLAEEQQDGLMRGVTGELIDVQRVPDRANVIETLQKLREEGYTSLAIAFAHSFTFDQHEIMVADWATQMGFHHVSLSCQTLPMIGLVARAGSAVVDAYLSTVIKEYIDAFASHFEGGLSTSDLSSKLFFIRSDGGLCRWNQFSGINSILSGPAGGVIGYSRTCHRSQAMPGKGSPANGQRSGKPILALDMGGTSTDVSRFDGTLEHVFDYDISEIKLHTRSLNINTVAAGGSSLLTMENSMFLVGPRSAGSDPGPSCYGRGGPLCITDANLILGRLSPAFPQVFGPNEDQPLDESASHKALASLIAEFRGKSNLSSPSTIAMNPLEIAAGFVEVANESMCRPIRSLCQAKGLETAAHDLVCFGGAGGQHMCAVASNLGIRRIVVPRFSSILSAYGLALADLVKEVIQPCAVALTAESSITLRRQLDAMADQAVLSLEVDVHQSCNGHHVRGSLPCSISVSRYYNCRYQGTANCILVEDSAAAEESIEDLFSQIHQARYGFTLAQRAVIVDDVLVRATAASEVAQPSNFLEEMAKVDWTSSSGREHKDMQSKDIYFKNRGWLPSMLVDLRATEVGVRCTGPALLYDDTQTLLIEPGWEAFVLSQHVVIDRCQPDEISSNDVAKRSSDAYQNGAAPDAVSLSILGHRFMTIAEQMGVVLCQTAVSANVKERLDFSCALFNAGGDLVANAPHIPVHLGAMSKAVKAQIPIWSDKIRPGDVIVSNHPEMGGTHLPDITVITPAFHEGRIVFWTASRAHHADIGGISAGSMPPFSKHICQEGAQIRSFLLVRDGYFDEQGITDLLLHQPAQYPNCSGTRTLSDNLSDLRAQISANGRGVQLVHQLIAEREGGLDEVLFYMKAIQMAAEKSVRELLREIAKRLGRTELAGTQQLDDGSVLKVRVAINVDKGSAHFDFAGTSPANASGNLNAPAAITSSAILYVLRSMIASDIPLNQGCLSPISISIPNGCLLSPPADAAVVAGNVETSQQLADLLLYTLEACAGSQGTCNNLSFGYGGKDVATGQHTPGFGYYETICGGAGAGPSWDGQSAVHVHMTNTEIGDPESIERRYPVVVRKWAVRAGSGGEGKYRGGDGTERELEFTRRLSVAILAESRIAAPRGLLGGLDGKPGENYWRKKGSERLSKLRGKDEVVMDAGDSIVLLTPGGGGFGESC